MDEDHIIESASKVVRCKNTEELMAIRATLLVNFGKESKHKRYGFEVDDRGTVHNIMFRVIENLTSRLTEIKSNLEKIVCTIGCDRGVILLSGKGACHTETVDGIPVQVYDNECLSPLGDALIELHTIAKGEVK